MPEPDVPVQEVVANVGRGTFQPADEDRSIVHVKVIREELSGGSFPVELLGYLPPELLGLPDGLVVHPPVLGQVGDVGGGRDLLRRIVDCVLPVHGARLRERRARRRQVNTSPHQGGTGSLSRPPPGSPLPLAVARKSL